MIKDKARVFVPLPMNPLHGHPDINGIQTSTRLNPYKGSHVASPSSNLLHASSSSSQTKDLHISHNPTTIIEIIKPERQKHDSNDFIPAFAKPDMIQDSSMESATLINLEPLKAYFLQGEGESSFSQFFSFSPQMLSGYHGNFGLNQVSTSCQQSVQVTTNNNAAKNSHSRIQSHITKCRSAIQGHQLYPLTIKEVVVWVNHLHQYHLFYSETHANELYKLLCTIQAEMAHPFLTPHVLAETKLGMALKAFRHGSYEAKSKRVARKIVSYWRKLCLEM